MVPLRLQLHNFLSYGENCQPIEFDGVHVACLCGPNGHGKSALLDAMTWVLWGQARSNAADDLIRHSQQSMWVDFEFLLEGQRYRVVRKRTRGKTGQSDLQFQSRAADEDESLWRPLTGQGLRGTQERINQELRMDYETFINSAFILQGRADEFARKTPGDRKRILGEVLSLSIYDQLTEAARARRAEAQMRVNAAEAQIAQMERDHARLPELKQAFQELTAAQAEAHATVTEARAKLKEILIEKAKLDAARAQRDDLVRRMGAAEADLQAQRAQLLAVQRRVEAAQALIGRAEEIRKLAQELFALRREQEEMAAKALELRTLENERAAHQRRLQEEEYRLRTSLQLAQQRARDAHALAEKVPLLEKELADLQDQETTLERLEKEQSALQERLQELATVTAQAAAEQQRCAAELEKADERFQLLKSAQAICPLCEGSLPDEKRRDLGWKLRDEREALKNGQSEALQKANEANREQTEVRRRLQDLANKLKTGRAMRDRLAQLRQQHARCQEAAATLEGEVRVIEGLEAQLREASFAPETRQALADLEARIKAVTYDDQRFRQVSQRLGELGGAERDLHALEQAEASLPQDQEQVAACEAGIRAREEALAEDRATRAELDRELTRLPAVEAETNRLNAAAAQAELVEKEIAGRLAASARELERCEALAPELAARKRERDEAAKDQSAYEELAKAFGRNGIQALIIENSLPELETEANTLLSRMTEGQLHVRLKTQRELRAGGQAETLDIEISDGMGARRYELYSGGEAFRVNFAIRIALSKLLARRAGARLETLVIDEGFGSQDQEGRQRLVEAIQAVQDDFARILVITHIDELKEAFPTRIEVTKGLGGSQVAVY